MDRRRIPGASTTDSGGVLFRVCTQAHKVTALWCMNVFELLNNRVHFFVLLHAFHLKKYQLAHVLITAVFCYVHLDLHTLFDHHHGARFIRMRDAIARIDVSCGGVHTPRRR